MSRYAQNFWKSPASPGAEHRAPWWTTNSAKTTTRETPAYLSSTARLAKLLLPGEAVEACPGAVAAEGVAPASGLDAGEVIENLVSGAASIGAAALAQVQNLGAGATDLGITPASVAEGAMSLGVHAGEAIGTLISGTVGAGEVILGQLPSISGAATSLWVSPVGIAMEALALGADAAEMMEDKVSSTAEALGALLSL
ncbi:hypothetical protein [Kineosporia babensis]|uniref:Uncharacterized protein n=1 Tax=Kineosporia babensis TaxID=499548 RepID=A0A9X1NGR5_9ACTN|nr:hypothetical protein [Kineosporia babensis]MCD5312996.1 hypothetical protein [Kineosporia babensis]